MSAKFYIHSVPDAKSDKKFMDKYVRNSPYAPCRFKLYDVDETDNLELGQIVSRDRTPLVLRLSARTQKRQV